MYDVNNLESVKAAIARGELNQAAILANPEISRCPIDNPFLQECLFEDVITVCFCEGICVWEWDYEIFKCFEVESHISAALSHQGCSGRSSGALCPA